MDELRKEVKMLSAKIQSVQKKMKKAPADLKDQFKAFLAVRMGGRAAAARKHIWNGW